MRAAEDKARIELPVEEIERREEEWTRRNLACSVAASGEAMSAEGERYMEEWRASRDAGRRDMEAQMRGWGQTPPKTKSFIETENYVRASSGPAGATPLQPPPTEDDWKALERIAGRSVPEDLKRLYTVSDGGLGPGFFGLNTVQLIAAGCEDFRRRGPDYCGTVVHPERFIPLATERLDDHYDLDTVQIVSGSALSEDEELEPDRIYDIAFQSLAARMADWLSRP